LSPQHGASSGCGWRRRPTGMEGSCEYIKYTVADSRQGVVLQLGGLDLGLTTPNPKDNDVRKMYTKPQTWTDPLDKRPRLKKMYVTYTVIQV
jgi:hypothetical protein